ncbi:MAG: hypothetical protein B0D92_01145 [Spirochaeta sp. LUC14_002_19_P3]|nr:MAG: hypothetical protein B0D92_01145 [Spirochaeta sp. LUC14_002_19_P3]
MNSSFQKMVAGLKSFQKYVPSNLVKKLIFLGKVAVVGGEERKLTLFFSDIQNFTSISEELPPQQLVKELVRYLSMMSSRIIKHDGTVDKYMGDGVMAFWGAPDYVEHHAVQACYAALDCMEAINRIMEKNPNSTRFRTRIGLHTGDVIVGNMGSSERMDYTVIGDSVNLASRLEGLNKLYNTKIIISESTYYEVKDYVVTRLLDKVAVKGKKKGVYVYELIARNGEIGQTQKHFIEESDKAVRLYFGKEWEKALEIFAKLLRHDSSDTLSQILGTRCQEFLKNPPPENWDGVYIVTSK